MKVSLATEMAPPFILVALFFVAGIVFLILSGIWLLGMSSEIHVYFISFSLAAFSHLFLLGFVMMIIFGALYQLLPVVLEAPIFSKDFAYVQFYMYVVGLSLMVSGFSVSDVSFLIAYGAVITYSSMMVFCINVFLTFYRLDTMTLVGKFLLIATVFLCFSVTLGLILGLNLTHGFFAIDMDAWTKAHILGTLGGFVMMVVMGVSMVLVPMFSLSHQFNEMPIKSALYLFSLGILGSMLALIFGLGSYYRIFSAFFIVCGIGCYLYQMCLVFMQRARKQNDYWAKNIMFAWFCLGVATLGIMNYFFLGKIEWVMFSGVLFFFGFLVSFIVGHIYKIVPFLIWYEKFSPLVGKQKVPLLHQMIHTMMANTQTYLFFVAIGLQAVGVMWASYKELFHIGAILMLVSLACVAYNVAYAFMYKIKEN